MATNRPAAPSSTSPLAVRAQGASRSLLPGPAYRLGRDPEEWKEERAREIPVRRAGVPRDVANLIAFLCSDEASFISGQVIYIAGGPRA